MILKRNLNELQVSKNPVICFGAGKRFLSIMQTKPFILNKVELVADNDVNKRGQSIIAAGKTIQIISLQDLINLDIEFDILITIVDYIDIFKQLNVIEKLQNVSCYIIDASFLLPVPYTLELPSVQKTVIPKIIHYCWFGQAEIPAQNKKWMESWSKFCPDYEIARWDENNYDVTKNQYMYEAYKEKKWAFVSDFARLDIVYNYGGIYLDTDVELIKEIDDFLGFDAFFGFEDQNACLALGLGFGAKKYHPIVAHLLDSYGDMSFYNNDGTLNTIANPVYTSQQLEVWGFKLNNTYQTLNNVALLPSDVLAPKTYVTHETFMTNNTRSIHHYEGSWANEASRNNLRKRIEAMQSLLSMTKSREDSQ